MHDDRVLGVPRACDLEGLEQPVLAARLVRAKVGVRVGVGVRARARARVRVRVRVGLGLGTRLGSHPSCRS